MLQVYEKKTRNPRAITNTQSIATTETAILILRNRRTYNGFINQVEIEPQIVSVSSEANKNTIFRVRAIENFTSEVDFQTAGTNLVGDVAKTSVAFSGGRLLAAEIVSPGQGTKFNLKELNVRAPPGLHLIITGEKISGTAADMTASITWFEDL